MSKADTWTLPTQGNKDVGRNLGRRCRLALLAAAAVGILIAIAIGGLALYSSGYNDKVYSQVAAMGVDLSGKTRAEARAALLESAARYLKSPLVLRHGEQRFEVTREALGLDLQVDAAVQQAFEYGRTGSGLQQWRQRLPLLRSGRQLEPRYSLERAGIVAYLQGLAPRIAREPVSSSLSLSPDGKLLATAEAAGQQLDLTQATDLLYNHVASLRESELTVPTLPIEPEIKRDDFRSRSRLRREIATQGLTLTDGKRNWSLGPGALGQTIVAIKAPGELVGTFSSTRLSRLLSGIATDVKLAPVDATLSINKAKPVLTLDKPGQRLDTQTTVTSILQALPGDGHATVSVLPVPAEVTAEELKPARRELGQILSGAPTLTLADREWKLPTWKLARWIQVRFDRSSGTATTVVDDVAVRDYIHSLTAAVYRAPVNASLRLTGSTPVLTPDQAGTELDVGATTAAVLESLAGTHRTPMQLRSVPASLTEADLAPAKAQLDSLLSAPLEVRHGDTSWTVPVETLVRWTRLQIDKPGRTAVMSLDEAALRRWIEALAPKVYRAPVDADLSIQNDKPVLALEKLGGRLDVTATVSTAMAALAADHRAVLVTQPVPARLTAEDLAPAKSRLDTLLSSPYALTLGDRKWTIAVETLARWTKLDVDKVNRTATVQLDFDRVDKYVHSLEPRVYIEPRDGELTWNNGLVVTRQSADGREFAAHATKDEMLEAAFTSNRSLEMVLKVLKPRVPTDNLAALGIKDVIGIGKSQYGYSTWERMENIKAAARYLDNTVIAPGETFDFNEAIGAISMERGFYRAKVLAGDESRLGIGGGVCQVSTTMFRAAFWSGMPIEERNQHSLVLGNYLWDAPVGFDAAISQPNYSMKWTNTTDNWILVRAYPGNETMKVVMYGTDPGYDVDRDSWNGQWIEPPPDKIIKDPSLPVGYREKDQPARHGVSAVISRTLRKDGKVVSYQKFSSYYRATPNVYKVGTAGSSGD